MTKILVIEDDKDIRELVATTLRMEGYEPILASDGEEGLKLAVRESPHLILLDVMLPRMDGFEVTRVLRQDVLTATIPIIMLTARGRTADKLTGFGLGVDDYVTKPFDPSELLARVQTQLRHLEQTLLSELTGLPGNKAIERAIDRVVNDPTVQWAVLYVDIDNFKAYNDVYGFLKGNELIIATAEIIQQVVAENLDAQENLGYPHFVGHIGGDDFVVISSPDKAVPISKEIIKRFDQEVPIHYEEEDRRRGYVLTVDRRGRSVNYPLVTLSIGIVSNQHRKFSSSLDVSKVASEVKQKAKELPGSAYWFDMRR